MAAESSIAGLGTVPNELLEQILNNIASLQLILLARISRRFYATIRHILLGRLARAFTSAHGHNLIFECFPPELKSSTPYYHCEYVRTSVLGDKDARRIVSPTGGMSVNSERSPLISDTDFLPGCYAWRTDDFLPGCSPWYDFLPRPSDGKGERLSDLYSIFRPRLPHEGRNAGPSSSFPAQTTPSANVKLDPEANFAKLSSSGSLVKLDSRKADRLTNITTIFESYKRLNRTFLQEAALERRRKTFCAADATKDIPLEGTGKLKRTMAATVEDAAEEKESLDMGAPYSESEASERLLAIDGEHKIVLKVAISQKKWQLSEKQRQQIYEAKYSDEPEASVLVEEVEDPSSAATYTLEFKEIAIQALYILVTLEQSERSNIIHIPLAMVAT